MANQNDKPLWIINLLSMLAMLFGFIALWLFLPALLVVLGVNHVKPGAQEFNIAFVWGVPLMILANLLSLMALKNSRREVRGLLQTLGFSMTLVADVCIALILVMKFI